jgi:hypothetical protein
LLPVIALMREWGNEYLIAPEARAELLQWSYKFYCYCV